jgi:hypothetical protein
MKSSKRKKLIIDLITNDLINCKLVCGLHRMGVDAGDYYLFLNSTIFRLMGFAAKERTDALYDRYAELSLKVLCIDLNGNARKVLRPLAQEIYEEIIQLRWNFEL